MLSTSFKGSALTSQKQSSFNGRSSRIRAGVKVNRASKAQNRNKSVLTTKACGVFGVIDYSKSPEMPESCSESVVRSLCDRMAPRGPDGQGWSAGKTEKWHWALGHQRLSIMDPNPRGNQPFVKPDIAVVANGEIYNFKELYETIPGPPVEKQSESDSEVLMHLYRAFGTKFVPELRGMFAFILVDQKNGTFLAARDHVGIKPLYMGRTKGPEGKLVIASELKVICDQCDPADIDEFPAGHYYTPETGFVKFYNPSFMEADYEHNLEITAKELRDELELAVVKRMMSDVEFGMFLSGGVDSCIVGTLMRPHVPAGKRLPSYTVGMKDSPDVMASREIAGKLGYDHNERIFTSEEACAIIDKVIYHLETYEPELIRSSVPNYFLAEFASKEVKMCLTGEGADELFGGYVYFADAPDSKAFQGELNRIYGALGNVNLKRADRMTMAHGLEARVPFLDIEFTAKAMSLHPKHKLIGKGKYQREKAYLRNMFKGEIPEEILWRQKAMQCEGVGEDWVYKLQQYCATQVTDQQMAQAEARFPNNPPHTKEEYYYRDIFESYFPGLDRFTNVWEGGCRAGGAAWKSDKYTRAGLVDPTGLSHDLQEFSYKDRKEGEREVAAKALPGSPTPTAPRTDIPFSGKNVTPRASRAPSTRTNAYSPYKEYAALNKELNVVSVPSAEELLISGSDDRTLLQPGLDTNSYHVGPYRMPAHLVRSSCTCNPLHQLPAQAVQRWHPKLVEAGPKEFSELYDKEVRGAITRILQLPDGTGVVTSPSGTDIELAPVAIAKSLHPQAACVHQVVAAINEIGRGVAQAAGGAYTSKVSPVAEIVPRPPASFHLTDRDITEHLEVTALDARCGATGDYIDHSATIAEAVARGAAAAEPVIVHTVLGTKTNKREPFPEGTGCEAADASTFVVVDACQGRYTREEIADLLGKNALITITGSKAWCGPPFSGALLIPAPIMQRLQAMAPADAWVPDMMQHYFTRDDFPETLPAFRAQLPELQNKGLALRWLAALEEMEAYFAAGGDSEAARGMVAQWREGVAAEIEQNHPAIELFEENDTVLNIKVAGAGQTLGTAKLRVLYRLLAEDAAAEVAAAGVALTPEERRVLSTKCLIGQPVHICEDFGIVRLALGANDVRALMEDLNVQQQINVDAQILRKISLIARHAETLLRA